MEHSHRGKVFDRIINEAEQACRDLAGIPDNYRVLFLQGGASLQFSMVPMNLLPADQTADYLVDWSLVAEGGQGGQAGGQGPCRGQRARPPTSTGFRSRTRSATPRDPAYVHLTTNNTIYGTQWRTEPSVPAKAPPDRGHIQRHVQPADRCPEVRD